MLRIILLLGLVSLLGDFVYEGARSVYGSFFQELGINAFTLGLIIGLGELLAYGLRLVSGYVADKTKNYWALTLLGYALIISIPLLGFAKSIYVIALLVILERIGKGIRTPARDTILSFVTKKIGRGFGFGLHEALDQIGAVLGPITFSVLIAFAGYGFAFKTMFIPTIALLALLLLIMLKIPNPEKVEGLERDVYQPKAFYSYIAFVFLCGIGFLNFPLIAYHYKVIGFRDEIIPLIYAFAMVVDAFFAPIVGKLYDKIGLKTLTFLPLTTALAVLSLFNPIAIAFFGISMALQETVMRAVVADCVGVSKRGFAYGLFNTAYGVSLFVGSAVLGYLYANINVLIAYVLAVELFALLYLTGLSKMLRRPF